MKKTYIFRLACIAPLGISLCLALVGCQGCSSEPLQSPTNIAPAVPAAPVAPLESKVIGNASLIDLGSVACSSRHIVVFVVENPSDQPLVLKSIRGDCGCISAINPPDRIAARSSVRISVSFMAPKAGMNYESRLLVATDNPNRKVISLRVKCLAIDP